MGDFQNLRVWQRAKDLSKYIFRVTNQYSFKGDYVLKDQIRRAVISISSNIAEGDELDTNKQSIRFFYIAKGSCAEVWSQTIIAYETGYIELEFFKYIQNECRVISSMLSKLIKARSK